MSDSARFISSARVTSLLTLLSRVLGLLREAVFGYYFSTGEWLSAFRIAFMIPNLARRLFGEGALSAAVIPILTQSLHEKGEADSRRFFGALLAGLSVLLVGGGLVAEAIVIGISFLHDDPAIRLTAITLPYMPLICSVALISGVLHVRGYFAAPAAAPILFNLVVLAATVGGAFLFHLEDHSLINVVCVGVLIGGAAQVILVVEALRRARFLPRWGGIAANPQVRAVLALMAPMFLGLSAVQVNALCDSLIAYLFIVVDGQRIGPAVLGYAQFLYQFPLGVFGIGLATAIFPVLSAKAAAGDHLGLADALVRGIRLNLFIALPATIGLMFVARPLVAVLYQHGEFTEKDTSRVAATLVCYSAGMAAYFTQHVVVRAFYALKDSKTPARVALMMVVVNVALNLVLVFPFQERGLAATTAFCAVAQVVWLFRLLCRRLPEIHPRPLIRSLFRIGAATGVMTVALAVLQFSAWLNSWIGSSQLVRLGLSVSAGVVIFIVAAKLLGLEEWDWTVHRKVPGGN